MIKHCGIFISWLGLVIIARGQFMKGSSPINPSNVLDTCQQQAPTTQYNVSRHGQHADVVNLWCSTYHSVVPCIERTLPATNNANDWFLTLVFNQTKAEELSRSMCSRFPTISNLTCVDKHLRDVATCMKWTTTSAISHFNELYNPNTVTAPKIRLKAFIYACVISDTTAKCFHRKLTSCSPSQRDLLYDYYIMLSGHCQEIMTRPETPTLSETADGAKLAERKSNPNNDLRPSPLDQPSQVDNTLNTVEAETESTAGNQQPGPTKTSWDNSEVTTKEPFRSRDGSQSVERVPIRTRNYKNAAGKRYNLHIVLVMVGLLTTVLKPVL